MCIGHITTHLAHRAVGCRPIPRAGASAANIRQARGGGVIGSAGFFRAARGQKPHRTAITAPTRWAVFIDLAHPVADRWIRCGHAQVALAVAVHRAAHAPCALAGIRDWIARGCNACWIIHRREGSASQPQRATVCVPLARGLGHLAHAQHPRASVQRDVQRTADLLPTQRRRAQGAVAVLRAPAQTNALLAALSTHAVLRSNARRPRAASFPWCTDQLQPIALRSHLGRAGLLTDRHATPCRRRAGPRRHTTHHGVLYSIRDHARWSAGQPRSTVRTRFTPGKAKRSDAQSAAAVAMLGTGPPRPSESLCQLAACPQPRWVPRVHQRLTRHAQRIAVPVAAARHTGCHAAIEQRSRQSWIVHDPHLSAEGAFFAAAVGALRRRCTRRKAAPRAQADSRLALGTLATGPPPRCRAQAGCTDRPNLPAHNGQATDLSWSTCRVALARQKRGGCRADRSRAHIAGSAVPVLCAAGPRSRLTGRGDQIAVLIDRASTLFANPTVCLFVTSVAWAVAPCFQWVT